MTNTPLPLRIAIAGLGTVGAGVVRLVQEQGERLAARGGRKLEIVAVSAKDRKRGRGVDLSAYAWSDDPVMLASFPGVDVVVELIGGAGGPAKSLCEKALAAGKHVVTANKALIAEHGYALTQQAEDKGVTLAFEAAVAGAVPILKAFREGLAANDFRRIAGIMNGTCNFILTEMERTGRPFDDILKEAQEKGFAEADPSFDIDGIDTAHKLAILTSLAYGTRVSFKDVHIEGIRHITPQDIEYAAKLGYRIKLLGIAGRTGEGIEQRVHPCMIAAEQPMARVPAEYNAIETEGDYAGKMFFEGRGAGGAPTASAVVADLLDIARGHCTPPFSMPAKALKPFPAAPMAAHLGAYYMRLPVIDKPGVLAAISTICFEEGVSVASCIQQAEDPGKPVQLAIITHEVREADMKSALTRIAKLDFITETPNMIRIEDL